jgi:hypothetical protein
MQHISPSKVEMATNGDSCNLNIRVTAPCVISQYYLELIIIDFLEGIRVVPTNETVNASCQKQIIVE